MRKEFLQGYRSFIAFVTGTILVAICLFLSKEQPQNFVALLTVWVGIMATFLTKNHFQSRLLTKGDKNDKKV